MHLDTCLTAGQPRWNRSGTLWEGIACWAERKATLTPADVTERVGEVLRWYAANGVLHVRSHVDVTDPALVALGALTDIGAPTPQVVEMLSGCDALVLECNHDRAMLRDGGYPRWLKERVGGPLGHLDNDQAAGLLGALERSRLQHVIGAHLSQQNNRPELARAALARALGCAGDWVGLATQEEGFAWRDLR